MCCIVANAIIGVAGIAPHYYYWDRYAWRDHRWPKGPSEMGWPYLADARLNMLNDPGEDWVPASLVCFGGYTVYRRAAIKHCGGTYSGVDELNRFEVEHASLSRCIREHNYTLFMNPSAFIRYAVYIYAP